MYLPFIFWISMHLPLCEKGLYLTDSSENNAIRNVLIIGDSHLVGDFGEYLHAGLHEKHKYDIVSIGIGGAGTYHFTVTMRGFCCGYRIRETCWSDTIPEKSKIPVTEEGFGATNHIVGKFFKGKLSSVVKHYNPDIVVIALGSNYTNAHEELMQILREENSQREIIWVGPMRRSNIEMRLYAISQIVKKYPDIRFIPSEDIIGHDTITSAHYSGKSAKYWAKEVIKRMDKHL